MQSPLWHYACTWGRPLEQMSRKYRGEFMSSVADHSEDVVTVHDILHERDGAQWHMHVSSDRSCAWFRACQE